MTWVRLGQSEPPLDLVMARKIPVPGEPEAGFGAITWDGIVILNERLVKDLNLTKEDIEKSILLVKWELMKWLEGFRGKKPPPDLEDRIVMLVDDGLASGYTMLASIKSVKNKKPKRIVVAIPTASISALKLIAPHVDEIICLNIRESFFFAVADAYQKWHDLSDEEVISFLKEASLV